MDGEIILSSDTFVMSLYTSASNANDSTLETIVEVTDEVADGNGYVAGGQQLAGVLWDVGDTPDEMRFSADSVLWTASGGPISDVQYAVLWRSNGIDDYLVAWCALDNVGPFTVPDGNPLSVAFTNEGIFELN
jgi:hypothetical protein